MIGQQTHEKMLSIINCQRNSNQNYDKVHTSHTPVKMAIIKKSTNNKHWRECGEKGTLYPIGGNVDVY